MLVSMTLIFGNGEQLSLKIEKLFRHSCNSQVSIMSPKEGASQNSTESTLQAPTTVMPPSNAPHTVSGALPAPLLPPQSPSSSIVIGGSSGLVVQQQQQQVHQQPQQVHMQQQQPQQLQAMQQSQMVHQPQQPQQMQHQQSMQQMDGSVLQQQQQQQQAQHQPHLFEVQGKTGGGTVEKLSNTNKPSEINIINQSNHPNTNTTTSANSLSPPHPPLHTPLTNTNTTLTILSTTTNTTTSSTTAEVATPTTCTVIATSSTTSPVANPTVSRCSSAPVYDKVEPSFSSNFPSSQYPHTIKPAGVHSVDQAMSFHAVLGATSKDASIDTVDSSRERSITKNSQTKMQTSMGNKKSASVNAFSNLSKSSSSTLPNNPKTPNPSTFQHPFIGQSQTPQSPHHHHHHPVVHHLHPHHHPLTGSSTGPAPNVTVNPNGAFNTNSNAVLRPGFANPFRPFSMQPIHFGATNQPSVSAVTSPILAAQLQTINQIASNQAAQFQHQQHHQKQSFDPSKFQSSRSTRASTPNMTVIRPSTTPIQSAPPAQLLSPSHGLSDQHIRVLTPSEIMRTLPTLPSQDAIASTVAFDVESNRVQSDSSVGSFSPQNHSHTNIAASSKSTSSTINNTTSNTSNEPTTPNTNLTQTSLVVTVATPPPQQQQHTVRDVNNGLHHPIDPIKACRLIHRFLVRFLSFVLTFCLYSRSMTVNQFFEFVFFY